MSARDERDATPPRTGALDEIRRDHYSGFEPEAGVSFYLDSEANEAEAFRVWDGYFDPIFHAALDTVEYAALPDLFRQYNELRGFMGIPAVPSQVDLERTISALDDLSDDALRRHCPSYWADVRRCLDHLVAYLRLAETAGRRVLVADDL